MNRSPVSLLNNAISFHDLIAFLLSVNSLFNERFVKKSFKQLFKMKKIFKHFQIENFNPVSPIHPDYRIIRQIKVVDLLSKLTSKLF